MKYHKVIPAMSGVLTIKQLEALDLTKSECFENYGDDKEDGWEFDYALPQDWLNDFAGWCKNTKTDNWHRNVTYDLIASTTVWVYPPLFGEPCTCCHEVYLAYQKYESSINV